FARLSQLRNIIVSRRPLLDSEGDEVYAILMQAQKRRRFGSWRAKEAAIKLLRGPDQFQFPAPPPLTFPPLETVPLPVWLANLSDRQDWQDTLQARIDQQQAVHSAMREAVGAVEEAALPQLRDALVWASNDHSFLLETRAKWIGDRLLIDTQNSGCAMTTRVSQAIETIQGLLFSIRTQILTDTYPQLKLDDDDFDETWEWIGSYATWRTAMFVFLYPENILIPSLRTRQTPAFRSLISSMRSNRLLNSTQAREAGDTYAKYVNDIATLKLEASCQTKTNMPSHTGKYHRLAYPIHLFARGGISNAVYWSHYDPKDPSPYAQSFWEAVPGMVNVINVLGAVPFEISEKERYIFLFARVREKGAQKLVFTKYDLIQLVWDTEQTELELPEEATQFTAVTLQRTRDVAPRLAIRVESGAIYSRLLNIDGTDWADGEWIPVIGSWRGDSFEKLCGMVEFSTGAFCTIVSGAGGLYYLLSGDWNDGYWRFLATGDYRGAFFWPDTSEVYVFWSQNSQIKQRAIRPIGNLPEKEPITTETEFDSSLPFADWLPYMKQYNTSVNAINQWLVDVAGVSLQGVTLPQGMPYGGLDFYKFLKLRNRDLILAYINSVLLSKSNKLDEEAVTIPSDAPDLSAILEKLTVLGWVNSLPGLMKLFRNAAVQWL